MADYFALVTAAGQAEANTAMLDGVALPLVDLAVGDGGGASYDPTGAETDLVNETARVPIEAVYRDPTDATILIIEAVVPSEDGGFWVREVGVFTAAGDLFAIGKLPPAFKPEISDGAAFGMMVRVRVKVAAAAQVQLVELSGDFYATRDWSRANTDFFAVISASTAAPPAAPTGGDQYLVPAGAAGAWAGQAGKVAHWRGALEGWQFIAPREGAQANVADASATLVKTAEEWVAIKQAAPDFFAVISASTAAPPAAPTAGDQYLVPAGAAGGWADQVGKVAHWRGALEGWQFIAPRNGSVVRDATAGRIYSLSGAAWRAITATQGEHVAGLSDTLLATPAGVAAMIAAQKPVAVRIFNFRNFT